MARGKTTPPPKTVVVVDAARTIPATHENYDERIARVPEPIAIALDYANGLVDAIMNVCAPWRPAPTGRWDVYEATSRAREAIFRVRYGVDVLTRQKMSSR